MSETRIGCPGCGKLLRILGGSPGQEIICPHCGQHFRLRSRTPAAHGGLTSSAPGSSERVAEADFEPAEHRPRRRKRRKSGQSTLFLILAGGALGLGLIALIIAFVVAYIMEKPRAGQAQQVEAAPPPQARGQLDGPRFRGNPSQADRNVVQA